MRNRLQGNWTTRAKLGTELTGEEIINRLVEASALTRGDIESVFQNLLSILAEADQNGRPADVIGIFRVKPKTGGALDDPDESVEIDDIDPRIGAYCGAELQGMFQSGLSLESRGIARERVPEISLVRNDATRNLNVYTPGDVLTIQGEDLKVHPTQADEGVFLVDTGGTEVKMTRYIRNTNSTIQVLIPGTLSGAQTLIIRTRYTTTGTLRSTTWSTLLTQG